MQFESSRVSVVVPTRGRPELLQCCLAALERQSLPVEVVVVEDVEGRGPAWARNEGVRRSQGEVICFTDDDCEPTPGWAAALAAPILEGKAEATSGPVAMGEGATAADKAWEVIVNYLQARAAVSSTASPGFAVTANLAAGRALLERFPFDESFRAAAGEDRDWAERVTRAGVLPRFVSQALVVHRSGARAKDFLRQQYRYGKGAARYRAAASGRELGSISFYTGLIQAGFDRGIASGLLVCAAQAATAAGALVESVSTRTEAGLRRTRG